MNKIILKGLDETVYHEKLENGLNIYVLRKEDYSTFSCYFITNFGALVDNFIPINEKEYHKFPKGVAHFLEHKMFEQETGPSVMEKFSSLLGTFNASTNYEYTSYYVNGTDNFEENLLFLIDYVQSPYFTDENVEKEKGIIDEERMMSLDQSGRTFSLKILDNIFNNYEYGKTIVGEKEDIYNITKEDLYRCYNTFYNPSNMSVIVVSNKKEEYVIDLIKNNQKNKKFDKQDIIKIKEVKEDMKVNKEYDCFYDNVEMPKVSYNIKMYLPEIDKDFDKIGLAIKILLGTNFSKMSDFNLNLKNKNITSNNLYFSASKFIDYCLITIRTSTCKCEEFIKEIKYKFNNLDLSEEKFNLLKKTSIANTVYSFTTTEGIMGYLLDEYYDKKIIPEDGFIKLKEFTYNDYLEVINKMDFNNVNITIMRPLDERK